jgi:uncharacterized repeat protein (TIGR01451 family)
MASPTLEINMKNLIRYTATRMRLVIAATLMFALGAVTLPAEAAYTQVYSTIQKGALTFTGNTLVLNHATTAGSGAAFISVGSGTVSAAGYPIDTTLNYLLNKSRAQLTIPSGATVLYAELIWSGSLGTAAQMNGNVSFVTPGGTYSIAPNGSTASANASYYTRSANVTGLVQLGGSGTYTTGAVYGLATGGATDSAGWTLAVAYADPSKVARNLTIFVGQELSGAAPATVSGFCTPVAGPVNGRALVSAIEGDTTGVGDRFLFGPTSTLTNANSLSGPNNAIGNFFASQINGDTGTLDTSGTFGTRNQIINVATNAGTNVGYARQAWDITNVDASAFLTNSQTTASAQGITSGDVYGINAIGLQINVTSPVFPVTVKSVNKTSTFIGDTIRYSVNLDNTSGNGAATGVTIFDTLPAGMVLVPNSVTLNGVAQIGADPGAGVPIGNVPVGSIVSVAFDATVVALPASPAPAKFDNFARWTYTYIACAGVVAQVGEVQTAPISVTVARLEPVKTVSPTGPLVGGQTATYTISIPNTGLLDTVGTTLADPIPPGTTYVAGSTKVNGIVVADGPGGTMPFATAALINSAGKPAGVIAFGAAATVQFSVVAGSAATVLNTATIDPDGAGPGSAKNVSAVNSGLSGPSVSKAFSPTTIGAGGKSTVTVTLTNPNATAITGVNVTDNLPSGMVIASPANVGTSCPVGAASATPAGTTLALSGATIPASGACTFSADVTVAIDGTYTNTIPAGAVSSTNAGLNTAGSQSLTVTKAPALSKAFSPGTVAPNATSTLTITLTNPTAAALTAVTFTDLFPSTATGAPGNMTLFDTVVTNNCGGTLTDAGGSALAIGSASLKLVGGSIGAVNVCTITVRVKAPTGGAYGNTIPTGALSTSGGVNSAPATATLQIASPQISKTFSVAAAPVNTGVAMTVTLTNVTGAAMTSVAFTDTYPVGLVNTNTTVTNATGCGGVATASVTATNPGTLTFTGGNIAAGDSCDLVVTVQSATPGSYTNTIAAGAVSSNIGSNVTGASATLNIARPNISKVFGAATIPLNGTTALTITLSNPTTVAMTAAAFTDTLPAGLTASVPAGTCAGTKAASGSTVSLSAGTIPAGTATVPGTCTVTATITGATIGIKTNTIAAGALTVAGPASNPSPASATVTVLAPPTITKSFLTSPILPVSGVSTLQIVLNNPNSVALNAATFIDTFPTAPGAMTVNDLSTTNTCGGTLVNNLNTALAIGNAGVRLNAGIIPSNGSCTITVNVKASVAGDYTNTIPATPTAGFLNTTEGGGNTVAATAPLAVRLAAPIVTKTFSPTTIVANASTTMTLTITNPSTTQAITGVSWSDIFPAGMKVFSTPAFSNSCGGSVTAGNVANDTSLAFTGGTVPFNAGGTGSCSISVAVTSTVVAASPGLVNITGTVTSTNANTSATATANLIVTAPPLTSATITKSFLQPSIGSGDISTIRFTIGSANVTILNNANFTDTLTNMSVASTTIGGGCVGVTNTPALVVGATALNLTVPNLAPGGCTVEIQVTSTNLGTNPNSVSGVTTTQVGAGAGSGPVNLTVLTKPTAVKTFTPNSVAAGGSSVIKVSIVNTNATPLTGAAFTDNYPVNLTNTATPAAVFTAASVTAGCTGTITAVANGTALALSGGNIPANATCDITVNVKTLSLTSTTHTNPSFTVTTTNAGTATVPAAVLTITGLNSPTISKSFSAPSVALNGNVTITFTLNNSNPVLLTGAAFTDALTGMAVATPLTTGGTCANQTFSVGTIAGANSIALTGADIPASGSCTVTVLITGTVAGNQPNTTSGVTTTQTPTAGAASNTANLAVMAPPTVTKTFLTNPVAKDAVTVLSIAITNPNGVAITGAAFTDNFPVLPDNKLVINNPPNAAFMASSITAGCTGTITGASGARIFSLSGGTIPANATCTLTVDVKSSSNINPTYVNSTGTITTANAGSGAAASDSLSVVNGATIDKNFSPASINAGATSQLTITLGTTAGGSGSSNAAFVDTYPTGLVNVAGTPLVSNSCGGSVTANAGAGSVSLSGGNIPGNSTCSIVVNVTAAAAGPYVNTIPVGALTTSSGAPNNTNSVGVSATLTVTAPLVVPTISKNFAASSIVVGGKTQLTITVGNSNASALTLSSALVDTLPTAPGAMIVATPNNLGGTCPGVTAAAGSGTITVASGTSIPAGGCTVTVDITASALGSYTNTIAAGALVTNAGNNASAANASLVMPALPTITKSFAPTAIAPGGASTMTFSIGNINAGALTNVNFSDTLSNMSVVSATVGGTCVGVSNSPALTVGATALSLTIPSVPAGGCSITLQVTGSTLGVWPNITSGATATQTPVVGAASNTANLQITNLPPNYILGTVFEDVNYGGGAGRSLASSGGVGVGGVRVELYNSLGSFVSFTITAADGSYAFTGLATANYTVRVANLTIASTRAGGCAAGTCIPVQTFRTNGASGTAVAVTDRVGGESPTKTDAGNGSTSLTSLTTASAAPQSITTVAVSAAGTTGVDFGYNFDTIVNKSVTGQGSLQQFVVNSNALGGEASLAQAGSRMNNGVSQSLPTGKETSIFMVADALVHPGLNTTYTNLLTSSRVLINYTTGSLSAITGPNTIIDGTTQSFNVGNTNAATSGTGGSVGLDGLSLGTVQLPEVELQGRSALPFGVQFNATASNGMLRGLAVWKFGAGSSDGSVAVNGASGVLIEQNLIGTTAASFASPGAGAGLGVCVQATSASTLTLTHNLIGFCSESGVVMNSTSGVISNNEIRGNVSAAADGIRVSGASSLSVSGNLITANGQSGIQLLGGVSNIQNNSLTNNSAVGIWASGVTLNNIIHRNIITGTVNAPGPGIFIENSGITGNRISQNSIAGNRTLGIDLGTLGVTGNDGIQSGANRESDYPIFTLGTLAADGVTLHVKGYVGNAAGDSSFGNATIELFKANNDANQNGEVIVGDGKSVAHGEGQTYLGTITTNASGNFDVTITVSGMTIGSPLSATATVCNSNPCATFTSAGDTSEFSANYTLTPVGINVSGTVYNNVNHNGIKDPGETGTGLTLFAKLIQGGVVQQVVPIDTTIGNALSGTYTFTAVTIGTYSIIIDNNNLIGDAIPTLPAGWVGTEVPNQTLPLSVTQSNTAMPNQNFGLYNGSKLSGTVFKDTGNGVGGIANDHLQNGGETGIAGVNLTATNASCPSSLCDSTVTTGNGSYTLYIPAIVGSGLVGINETNPSGYLSTGGAVGSTVGGYLRPGDSTSFTNGVGSSYSGVNFADVPDNVFLTDGAQNGLPGTVVFYAHSFTAGTAGSVSFSTTLTPPVSTPASTTWSNVLYPDSNCNGVLDGTEGNIVLGSQNVSAGQTVCVLVKEAIPAGAPLGAKDVITLTATFNYSNASPALTTTATRTDTTTAGAVTGALVLVKSVDKAYALPNEVITYTITYTNTSHVGIANITINDAVPAHALYVGGSAGCPTLATRTTCTVPTEPANNALGQIKWLVSGNLAPGASNAIQYQVRVEQ